MIRVGAPRTITVSPQLNITQTIIIPQAEILTLNSVPNLICPAEPGYINIFHSAVLIYKYTNSIFTNVNNVLAFYAVPPVGSPILVSNSLNATNILGIDQSTNANFSPANPYSPLMSASANSSIVLQIAGNDPIGGDPGSLLSVIITYHILQA